MDSYDCYELRKGTCSLYLSKEEAFEVSNIEKENIGESSVMYCRNLAENLLNTNYYKNKSPQDDIYSIRVHKRDCGHYEFTDGQHRTCIAKHLNIDSIYANIEIRPTDYTILCSACREKENKDGIKSKIRSIFSSKKARYPYHIIDDEYMKFKWKF